MRTKHIICFYLFIASLFLLASCGKKNSIADKDLSKAQAYYDKNGFDKFVKYIEKKDYFPIHDNSNDNATPLLVAIKNSDLENAVLFLSKGASLYETDGKGRDVLDYALANDNENVLEWAVAALPNDYWNKKDASGISPLSKIISNSDNTSLIEKIFEQTGNFNEDDGNGKTPLMYAAQSNIDVRLTKYLLDNQAKIDAKNSNEWTAIMYAARYNPNPAVMEDLILRGANRESNSVGLTLTMLASCNPNTGVLLTLFKYDVGEINAQTDKGKSALMYACENQQDTSVLKMLIDNGADVDMKDSDGKTVLMYAVENYTRQDEVYFLITAGANYDDADNSGKTVRDYLSANNALHNTNLMNTIYITRGTVGQDESHGTVQKDVDDTLTVDENVDTIANSEDNDDTESVSDNTGGE